MRLAGVLGHPGGATTAAFAVAPRFVVVIGKGATSPSVLVDGFDAGYVWAESKAINLSTPNTRRPLKEGYYDHAQNCLEYIVLAFGPTAERKPRRTAYESLRVYRGHDCWMA